MTFSWNESLPPAWQIPLGFVEGENECKGKRKMTSCLERELFPVPCDAHRFVYAVREEGGGVAAAQLLLLHAGADSGAAPGNAG